jgi:hypothetical protein
MPGVEGGVPELYPAKKTLQRYETNGLFLCLTACRPVYFGTPGP